MENELKMRQFVRQTLMEVIAPVQQDEPGTTSKDILKNEDFGENTLNEKNQLDDRNQQGVDKIFAKVNDKIK